MLNVYIPLQLCGTQYRVVECGPPYGCAGREVEVGVMRVISTFLWMSDPSFNSNFFVLNVADIPSRRCLVLRECISVIRFLLYDCMSL